MHRHLITITLAAALAGCASTRTADTVAFKVEGMACRNCANEIAHELEEVPGVRAASIDFDTATARVTVDPANPPSTESLQAAVAKWKKEHFALPDDPDCQDPERRRQLQQEAAQEHDSR